MDEFKLNVSGEQSKEENNNPAGEKPEAGVQNERFLDNIRLHDIARVFSGFSREKRIVVIPIGFPQAGKSLFLSSLMYYARKGNDSLFRTNLENDFPFNNGRKAVDVMVDYFETGKLYATTKKGTLDLLGINITPNKKGLPNLKLAFLDLAGDDIEKIKTSKDSQFTNKINAVFNGLAVDESPVIFTLITPFDPVPRDSTSPHHTEDTLHYDFLNYIKQNQPHLLDHAKFFIVVSQWDKNHDKNLTVEEYIRKNRPSIFNYVKHSNVVWGEYSIGKILVTKDENEETFQEIVRINHINPARYWKKLYQICTGKNLEKKSWLKKLFE